MSDLRKINITNTTASRIGVVVPSISFRRDFMPGQSFPVEEKQIEELMYDPGFRYMIETGMLYIEDMDIKHELGIEPEDADEPVNIIVLSDKERRYYMINLSLENFQQKVDQLGYEQIQQLADYAVANRLADFDKCKYLKEKCGRDVIQAIRLGDQMKEE